MPYRPLSVVSDFTEDLFAAFLQAREAGLEMDQIETIVKKQLAGFEKELADRRAALTELQRIGQEIDEDGQS